MVQYLQAFGAESVSAVNKNTWNSFSDIEALTAVVAVVKTPGPVITLDYCFLHPTFLCLFQGLLMFHPRFPQRYVLHYFFNFHAASAWLWFKSIWSLRWNWFWSVVRSSDLHDLALPLHSIAFLFFCVFCFWIFISATCRSRFFIWLLFLFFLFLLLRLTFWFFHSLFLLGNFLIIFCSLDRLVLH